MEVFFVSSSSKPVSYAFSQQKLISTPKALDISDLIFPRGVRCFFLGDGHVLEGCLSNGSKHGNLGTFLEFCFLFL